MFGKGAAAEERDTHRFEVTRLDGNGFGGDGIGGIVGNTWKMEVGGVVEGEG